MGFFYPKNLKRHEIDWLVWRLTMIIACTQWIWKKKFLKNKNMKIIVKNYVKIVDFIIFTRVAPPTIENNCAWVNVTLSMSCTKWSIHFSNMHVTHVNRCCEIFCVNSRLLLFSHAPILCKKLSLSIVEHGMNLIVEHWHSCLQAHNIFQMMETFSMIVMMILLKVKRDN